MITLAGNFLPMPKAPPILKDLTNSTAGAWMLMAFGITLAPLTEELAFRGFLLPSLVNVFRWLERRGAMSESSVRAVGIPIAIVLTSIPFAMVHAQQVSGSWGPLLLIGMVSVVLCIIRLVDRFGRGRLCGARLLQLHALRRPARADRRLPAPGQAQGLTHTSGKSPIGCVATVTSPRSAVRASLTLMNDISRLFQAFVAPAIFFSATALFILSINVRLMGIVSRLRQYVRARHEAVKNGHTAEATACTAQIESMERRAEMIRRTFLLSLIALVGTLISCLLLGFGLYWKPAAPAAAAVFVSP